MPPTSKTPRSIQKTFSTFVLRIAFCLSFLALIFVSARDVVHASYIPVHQITIPLTNKSTATELREGAAILEGKFNTLAIRQVKDHVSLFDPSEIKRSFANIDSDLDFDIIKPARTTLHDLQSKYSEWDNQLTTLEQKPVAVIKTPPPAPPRPAEFTANVPIMIYHKTPGNLDALLTQLESKQYYTITMAQLLESLRTKKALPGKPIILTFDDGFSDQLDAFALLKKHQMKALFYIISGGERSGGCIGVTRTNGSCGDSYLTWEEIRALDASGLIEIGGHTVDHLSLPAQTPEVQQFEINQNKLDIETALGHKISAFAYPMGNFDTTSINIVRKAGYTSAVSTQAGTTQSASIMYSLHRVRDVNALP